MPEDMANNLVPLEKLISGLRRDLKLAKTSWVSKTYGQAQDPATQRKNLRKASTLYYLELLQNLKNLSAVSDH